MALDLQALVEQAREEFESPLLTADEVAHCLYRAAQLAQADGHDIGVLLKPNGSGGMSPIGRISLDILIDIPDQQEYDAFASADGENGAPGPAIPIWDKKPYKVGKCAIVNGHEKCSGASMDRVRRPTGTPAPIPVPDPVPPSPDPGQPQPTLREILDGVDAIFESVKQHRAEVGARLTQLEEAATQPRPIELRVPAFGGTARGTLKSAD